MSVTNNCTFHILYMSGLVMTVKRQSKHAT
jgi:hypothetical protein